MPGNTELQRRLGAVGELLQQVESAADPSLRTTVRELVELVMNLHGAGLERMLELIRGAGGASESLIERLGRDELVGSLLVLHGIHPVKLEMRVIQALDKVRPHLRKHGAEVELLSARDGIVELRMHADRKGCGSSAQSLQETVEEAVYEAAPDLVSLTFEEAGEKQNFVPLDMLLNSQPAPLALNGTSGKGGL